MLLFSLSVDFSVWETSTFPQFSRTLLCILADLCGRAGFGFPSNFQSFFLRSLGTVQRATTTIGITVTFMIHIFFSYLARSVYLFTFFHFYSVICWKSKIHELTSYYNYYYHYYYYFTHCVSWRSFTEIWETVGLFGSPGLFLVFWLIWTILWFV